MRGIFRRRLIDLLPALAVAFLCVGAEAKLPIHDPETEELAKQALQLYGEADLESGFAAARANLDALHGMEMESILLGAEFQASQALRTVIEPGGAGFSPEVRTFEILDGAIGVDCDDVPDRLLADFLGCSLGVATTNELSSLRTYMDAVIGAVAGSESRTSRLAVATSKLPKDDQKVEDRVFDVYNFRVNRALTSIGDRPPKRNVSLAPDVGAGDIAPKLRSPLSVFVKKRGKGPGKSTIDVSSAWTPPDPKTFAAESSSETDLEKNSAAEFDCSAIQLASGVITITRAEDKPSEDVLPNSTIRRKFDSAVTCWLQQSAATAAQKERIRIEKAKYAAIERCLAGIAGGLIEGPIGPSRKSDAATASPGARILLAGARVGRNSPKAENRPEIDSTTALAMVCSGDAVAAYLELLRTPPLTWPSPAPDCTPAGLAASPSRADNCALQDLMTALFVTPIPAGGECLLKKECMKKDIAMLIADSNLVDAKEFARSLANCGNPVDCDQKLARLTAAIDAIEKARLKRIDAELYARRNDGEKIKSIKEKLKSHAEFFDGVLETIASTASDLGVELAAVEAQLDAVDFVLDSAIAGEVPEFDADKACKDKKDDDLAACLALHESLTPRYRAAAAIAGSVPGFLDAMGKVIDELAEPPPLLLVIARDQLKVRSDSLRKRLALLDAEVATWRDLALNYRELVGEADALVRLMPGLCAAYGAPEGASCAPVAAAAEYKSKPDSPEKQLQRRLLLRATARQAHLNWLNRYGESAAFNKLIHLGHLNVTLIDEEAVGIADAAIGAMLTEIDFRGKRGLKPETVADFVSRLANLGLLTAIAVRGE